MSDPNEIAARSIEYGKELAALGHEALSETLGGIRCTIPPEQWPNDFIGEPLIKPDDV